MSQHATGVRFTPGDFKYNGRVAMALGPSFAVAAAIGGRPVMGILTIGAMIWYIMDTMLLREGAFAVGWATLALANFGLMYTIIKDVLDRPILLSLLVILLMGALFAMVGMWMTLQFRWIQMQYPAVVLAFERQVVTASVPLSAAIITMGISSLVEEEDVPYYLAALLCLLYQQLGRPLVSSFHSMKVQRSYGGSFTPPPKEAIVQSKLDSVVMALLAVCGPALMYLAIHVAVLGHWLHLWSLLLLVSVPLLFVATLPQGLWWLPGGVIVQTGLRRLLIMMGGMGVVAGFEGRVVFHAFSSYIQLQPPWNYVAVTAALFGLIGLLVAHMTGLLGSAMDITLAGSCLLLCTAAGGIAVGIPLQWLPAPLLAACGLALFYDSRSLREYLVFVIGAMVTVGWFIYHHFWFLDIRVGHLHLHVMCKMAAVAAVPALLVPGLVLANWGHQLVGVLLLIQAELVCVIEEQMFGAQRLDEPGADVIYPSYLIIMTSAAGVAVAQAMYRGGALPRWSAWVISTLYVAKLSMLLLPEAYLVMPTAVLLLSAVSPLFLHEPEYNKKKVRIAPWQGLVHVVVTLVALGLARFAVFDVVAWAVMGRPSEGGLLGALLLVAAAALAPLVVHCYSHNQSASRLLAALAVAGILLAILEPPLPRQGGASCPRLPFALCPRLWDARHIPMHDADDVAVWGSGFGRKEHWPRWLLISAAGVGMAGLAGVGPGMRTSGVRVLIGLIAGGLVGEFLALEVVPSQPVLQMLVIGSSVLVVGFCTLLQNPLLGSPTWLPGVGVTWMVMFVASMSLQASLPLPEDERFKRLFPDALGGVEDERAAALQASLLGVFAAQALLLAFSLKLRMSAALHQQDKAGAQPTVGGYSPQEDPLVRSIRASCSTNDYFCGVVPGSVFSQLGRRMHLEGAAGVAMRRLGRAGLAWVPTAGNVCTLLAFGTCLALNRYLTGGEPEAVFMLAPLLLMLSQDPLLLRQLGERQRYAPPAAAITWYLTATGAVEVCTWGFVYGSVGPAFTNGCMLLLALPVHLMFLKHLWDQKTQPVLLLGVLMAGGLVAGLVAWASSVAYLGLSGVAVGVLQFFSMRHQRHVGLKMV